jgi:ATP-binding cassette subfamily B protein
MDIVFMKSIELRNVSFQYATHQPNVLSGFNLVINKGDRIGFIGSTGCGKSTLLDIIMGLLEPSNGSIVIDGIALSSSTIPSWQSHISHVPQAIFLSDATIAENIAFGVPLKQINMEKVKEAAVKSCIAETIKGWPDAYKTIIGERGVRISGGQRQRIGLARALYKNSSLLILDEATSALDNKSEQSVMSEIDELDGELTLIIVAHRLTTLKGCTRVVEIEGGKIKRAGSYEEMIGNYNETDVSD